MERKKSMNLGEFITLRRKHMRLTQEQLAEKIHVSKSAIAKWETNGGIPERDNLKKLAEIIQVSVEDLYRIIESKDNEMIPLDINITADVISALESYGYVIIPPVKKDKD